MSKKQNIPSKPQPAKKPSIYIAIPAMNEVYTEFARDLSLATAWLARNEFDFNIGVSMGSVITRGRRALVELFLKSDCDYIWWLDSDMKFPPDAAYRLMLRNKEIVGCNYRRRRFPDTSFVSMVGQVGSFRSLETNDTSPPLELCDVIPHGCVLVKKEVYQKVPDPHYLQQYIKEIDEELGEDVYFCVEAQKAGYQIWIDHELSKDIAHIGTLYFNYNLTV